MESGRTAVVDRAQPPVSGLVIGLDLAGGATEMALPGVSSIIATRADHLGRWAPGGSAPRLWLAPDALDAIARRESGPGSTVQAVVAVPGWLGALDRAAVRALLGTGAHEVRVVASPSAAALAWVERELRSDRVRSVLCIDVGYGVSGAVVTVGPDVVSEVATSALPPPVDSPPGAEVRVEVLTALVGHLLRRARDAGVDAVDSAVLMVDRGGATVLEQWRRVVAAASRPGDLLPEAQVSDRSPTVATGAALAAGSRARPVLSCSLAHRLGVLVDDGAAVRVFDLLDAGRSLPATVEQLFAADATAVVQLDLVEARRPGAGDDPSDWSPVAQATWTGSRADAAGGPPSAAHVLLEVAVDADGVVSVGPGDTWAVEVGHGAVDWSMAFDKAPVPSVPPRSARPTAEPASAASAPLGAPQPSEADEAHPLPDIGRAGRSLAWPEHDLQAAWPPPLPAAAPASVSPALDAPDAADIRHTAAAAAAAAEVVRDALGSIRAPAVLDHEALEEIARAEIGGPSLPTALVELERQLSKRFGLLIGVRSVPALLDCDDDADLDRLRAGAERLEAALEHQPDDALTEAARAAVRAARRAFSDPQHPLFVGGPAESIAADAARVVEHLRLVVGEVVSAERQRIAHDARLRGLSAVATESLVSRLFRDEPAPPDERARVDAPLRDAGARVGIGHEGWSIEAHADPNEAIVPEVRPGLAQVRVLLLERCLGVL